jgi:hypothetical protein
MTNETNITNDATNDATNVANDATTNDNAKSKSRAKRETNVLITLAQIARDENRDPKIVRAFARRNVAKFEQMRVKNAHTRWVFNARDRAKIVALIKNAK